MWRLLLVLTAVAGIGLAAVEAGGVKTSAEEIRSYSSSTSLTVPCTPTSFPPQLWVRNLAGPTPGQKGTLDEAAPATPDAGWTREVENGFELSWNEDDEDDFATWATATVELPCGYVLAGRVTLLIDADGRRSDRLTAALFSCPAGVPPHSKTPGCRYITSDQADRVDEGDPRDAEDFLVRTVRFGQIDTTIPAGEQLRLKIINQRPGPLQGGGSTRDWNLKWGYRSDRQSQLVITP